jgi:predicted O-methyltransferase YrrM
LKLQQIPKEYSQLLDWLRKYRENNPNSINYLELGLGEGGSYFINNLFLRPNKSIAVDSLAYNQSEQEVIRRISKIKDIEPSPPSFSFHQKTTDVYFENLSGKSFFDIIFIDADHSYEGVKKDYENSLKHLKPNGHLIFHDINSSHCPGFVKLWREIKNDICIEFINSNVCGIGIWQAPE